MHFRFGLETPTSPNRNPIHPMLGNAPPFQLIETTDQLEAFFEPLSHDGILSLDTEFARDRSYYPVLCLLQIATKRGIVLIDALAIPSHDTITQALTSTHQIKLLHSGRQDIEALNLSCGSLPQRIHDTQIAAAICGFGDQVGYGRLVFEILGIELEKGHTRTDWTQRPLKLEQLHYAAEDVAFLEAIYEVLLRQLEKDARLPWLEEECSYLLQPHLYSADVFALWRKISIAQDLSGSQLYRLKHLAAWREINAQLMNLPRSWIARDEWLCEIASRPNLPLDTLGQHKFISAKNRSELIESLRTTLMQLDEEPGDEAQPIEWSYRPDTKRKDLLKRLSGLVRTESEQLNIPPSLLASKKDLENLIDNPEKSRITQGWRATVIGRRLKNELGL